MMQKIRNLAISYKQDGMLPLIEAKLQEALNLSGRSDDVFVLSGEVMEQNEALEKARRGQNWLLRYAISVWQCEIACFMGDYGRAAKHAEHARLVQKKRLEDLWTYTTSFYEVISVLAIARECDSIGRRLRLHKQANRILKYMRRLGKFGSPNFSHMITLVEAEVAWLHGSHDDALRKYDKAISLARQGRFRHHHALACERKALSLRVGGDHLGWSSAIVEARSLYSEWGALVKLEQLDKAIGKKDSVD
jgi:tetratricopeptide (TPR) repeat protein